MEHVIAIAEFSEEQQSILHNGGPGIESGYRLAWARTYLKKVTWSCPGSVALPTFP